MPDTAHQPDPAGKSESNVYGGAVAPCTVCLASGPWKMALAGLVAGVGVWLVMHPRYPFWVKIFTGRPSPEEADLAFRLHMQSLLALFALYGGAVAAALAVAEGLSRRSFKYALLGIVTGIALGAATADAGIWLAMQVHNLPFHGVVPVAKLVIVQAIAFGLGGLGIGLGVALPAARLRTIGLGAVGGAVGGLLAGVVYNLIASLVFSTANLDLLVPEDGGVRLAWLATGGAVTGLVLGGLAGPRKQSPSANPAS